MEVYVRLSPNAPDVRAARDKTYQWEEELRNATRMRIQSGDWISDGIQALGIMVVDLNDSKAQTPTTRRGVRVVATQGIGAKAGLRAGDIILAIDRTDVADTKQFTELAITAEKARRRVVVLIQRGEWTNYLTIDP